MNKIDISSLLKIIDIKNILAFILLIGIYFGVNIFYLSPNKEENNKRLIELKIVEEDTENQKKLVEEITAEGNDSIQTLIGKLAAYETVLPKNKIDTLELELTLRQIAGEAIAISSISRNSDIILSTLDTKAKFEVYTVKGVSSIGTLEQFLAILSFTSTPSDGTAIMTVEDITMTVARPKNASSTDLFDLQSSPNVDFEMNLRVWYNSEKGILSQAAEKAAALALAEQDKDSQPENPTEDSQNEANNTNQ